MQRKNVFSWNGIDNHGQRVRGNITAPNKAIAQNILIKKGVSAIKLNYQIQLKTRLQNNITSKHITNFTLQLANLLHAGIPLIKALTILNNEAHHAAYRKFITDIKTKNLVTVLFPLAMPPVNPIFNISLASLKN